MNASDMIELRGRRPFLPFTIRLRDGTSIQVDQPYIIATGRNSRECVIYESEDRVRFVAYRDIAEVVLSQINGA